MKSLKLFKLCAVSRFVGAAALLILITIQTSAAPVFPTKVVGWGARNDSIKPPEDLTNAVAVSASDQESLALRADGTVTPFGVSIGNYQAVFASLHDVQAISVGFQHGLLLRSNGVVVAWGNGGDGANTVPNNLGPVTAVAAGGHFNLALRPNGTVAFWGSPQAGVENLPEDLTNIVAITASTVYNDGAFALALRGDGTIVAWGANQAGQCDVPEDLDSVVAIAAGDTHGVALKSDGTVVSWGEYQSYQLPGGPKAVQPPPGLSNVVAIAASDSHSLALQSDGTVVAWGFNGHHESTVPEGLGPAIAIAAGGTHSLAICTSAAPLIITHPQSRSSYASAEDGTDFLVEAVGFNLSYQWFKDGVAISGATEPRIWTDGTQEDDEGEYYAVVSNPIGSVTSLSATLTVLPYLLVTEQPESQSVDQGANVVLSVRAKGSEPITYQWRYNRRNIEGATGNTLTINPALPANTGAYSVIISNHYAVVRSESATLVVASTNGPAIARHPQDDVVFSGAKLVLSVVASGQGSLQYQWFKNGQSIANQTQAELVFASTQPNDAGTYHVAVSDTMGTTISAPAVVEVVGTAPVFTYAPPTHVVNLGGPTPPEDLPDAIAIAAGRRHALALHADGTITCWGDGPGAGPPPGLNNVVAIAASQDFSLALKQDGTVASWGAVTLAEPLFGIVAIAAGDTHIVVVKSDGSLVVIGGGPRFGDDLDQITDVVSVAAGFFSLLALKEDGTVLVRGTLVDTDQFAGVNDAVAVSAGHTHNMVLRANGTVVDSSTPPAGLSNVVAIVAAANGSWALQANGTVVGWGAASGAGLTHVKAIAAYQSATPDNYLLALSDWPAIVQQPQSVSVNASVAVTLEVVATGEGSLSYQWSKDGLALTGQTGPTLEIETAVAGDAGEYTVTVSNAAGLITSSVATVTIYTTPIVTSPPVAQYVFVGAAVSFNVELTGAPPLQYQWLRDGSPLSGQTGPSLTIASCQQADAGDYSVEISNSFGETTSASAHLTVSAHSFSLPPPGTVVSLGGPVPPPGLTNIVAVAAGIYHSLALREDGTVVGWGGGFIPHRGNPAEPPEGLNNMVAIAAGHFGASLALKADGTLVGWGGLSVPGGLFGVVGIALSDRFALAIKADGSVVSWGSSPAAHLPTPTGAVAAAAGSFNAMALRPDGSVVNWGLLSPPGNLFGGAGNFVALALSEEHYMGLTPAGDVLEGVSSTPKQQNMIAIAASAERSWGIRADGTLVGWNGAEDTPAVENVSAISANGGYVIVVTTNPPVPMLQATVADEGVLVTAPISVSGFVLEATDDLSQPYNQVSLPAAENNSSTNNPNAFVDPKAQTLRFFRMRKVE